MEWKNEFLKLYISNDISRFSDALDLKLANIPEKLYRYRELSDDTMKYRFGEIIRGELYMAHPQEMNDPFEVCAHLCSHHPKQYFNNKKVFEDSFLEIIPKKDYDRVFSSDNWLELLSKYVAETMHKSIESSENAIYKLLMFGFENSNSNFNEISRKIVRFASFTTNCKNLPMWHHYTKAHTGICLEYNMNDVTNMYQKNKLFPVCYVDELPDIVYMLLNNKDIMFSPFEYAAMHKLKDWNYEDEWRLIYDVGAWYSSPNDIPEEFYNKGKIISFVKPSKIIMGTKISKEHKRKIEEIGYIANVPIVQAVQTEYGLDFK